ncbi:MAG: flagellar FlbD family protein [Clostridia bacterium]|jgi:flagellar protein FlbD|nr:flagellar FlbD family protein [Clostridia bacterium]
MIKVTNINGISYYLNCDLIEIMESIPDTLITLRDGKKHYVRETPEEVVEKIIEYKKRIFVDLPLINKG